jgi:DNA-binding FadR family transcriptional regulator
VAARRESGPVRVPKTAEVVAEHLRREIVTGVLTEGEALPAAAVLVDRFRGFEARPSARRSASSSPRP